MSSTSREVILPLSETLTDRSKTGATHDAYASRLVQPMFPFALLIAGCRNKADREKEQTPKRGGS
jgi:hypothetical protein